MRNNKSVYLPSLDILSRAIFNCLPLQQCVACAEILLSVEAPTAPLTSSVFHVVSLSRFVMLLNGRFCVPHNPLRRLALVRVSGTVYQTRLHLRSSVHTVVPVETCTKRNRHVSEVLINSEECSLEFSKITHIVYLGQNSNFLKSL